jgi:secreted trypsin-like serine protease
LIKTRVILSAGHCFPKTLAVTLPDSGRVVRGELSDLKAEAYFKKDSRSDSPWGVRAERIIVHEGFREDWISAVDNPWNPTESIADLAILSLSESPSADKESVELFTNEDQPLSEFESVTLAGYGRDVSDGQISIPRLRRVEVPYREELRNQTEWFVGGGNLARAGKVDRPQGACMGDSGGPLFVQRDGKAKLAGIIVRGPSAENGGCEASITIVTALPSYNGWIEEKLSRLFFTDDN